MDCIEIKNQFSSYLDDRLSEPNQKQFLIHLENCPACHKELQCWQTISVLCRTSPQADLPAHFSSSLHHKLVLAKEEMARENSVQNGLPKQTEIAATGQNLPKKAKHKWATRQYITLAAGLVLFVGVSWYGADAFLLKSGVDKETLPPPTGEAAPFAAAGNSVATGASDETQGLADKAVTTAADADILQNQSATKSMASHYVLSTPRNPSADTAIANRSGENMLMAGLGQTGQAILDDEIVRATIVLTVSDEQTVVTKAYELAKMPGIQFTQVITDQNNKMTGLLMIVPKEQLAFFVDAWRQFAVHIQYTEQKENVSGEYSRLLQEKDSLTDQGDAADEQKLQEVNGRLKQWTQKINSVTVTIQIAS